MCNSMDHDEMSIQPSTGRMTWHIHGSRIERYRDEFMKHVCDHSVSELHIYGTINCMVAHMLADTIRINTTLQVIGFNDDSVSANVLVEALRDTSSVAHVRLWGAYNQHLALLANVCAFNNSIIYIDIGCGCFERQCAQAWIEMMYNRHNLEGLDMQCCAISHLTVDCVSHLLHAIALHPSITYLNFHRSLSIHSDRYERLKSYSHLFASHLTCNTSLWYIDFRYNIVDSQSFRMAFKNRYKQSMIIMRVDCDVVAVGHADPTMAHAMDALCIC